MFFITQNGENGRFLWSLSGKAQPLSPSASSPTLRQGLRILASQRAALEISLFPGVRFAALFIAPQLSSQLPSLDLLSGSTSHSPTPAQRPCRAYAEAHPTRLRPAGRRTAGRLMALTFLADAVSHEAHKSYTNVPSLV
jgi:hypothetical protein